MKRKKTFGNNPKFKIRKPSDRPSTSRAAMANRFSPLDDDSDDVSEYEEGNKTPLNKIPPIVVDVSTSFSNVHKLMGSQYKFQRMSIGTKVISSTLPLYEDALKLLKDSKVKFYTHQLKDFKKFKLVLFGLPKLD
ncbi:hypothetical protein FF38_04201 [Lucilia cuprina]|uniref:Uncharacterized protein n=1 Tax=Lucilia cuprina TaxID=7375 RepID=A0A0L0BX05_LUCCU|nr:hypothetical protein FF38_04201 [Lucilia cuprina]